MLTVTIEEAQANLPGLIEQLREGEEIVIQRDESPIARLVFQAAPKRQNRTPGTMKGTVLYMAPDFDAPLDDFNEYVK